MSSERKLKLPKLPKNIKKEKNLKNTASETKSRASISTKFTLKLVANVKSNIENFAVRLGLNKFIKNKDEWKKFYVFASSDFIWSQPSTDINERRLIFDYVINPDWDPIREELAINALEYCYLLEFNTLDLLQGTHILIVHEKFVRYRSSKEEKKMREDYPECYYVSVKEHIVKLRRFLASDANTNAGAEKEWQ
ncbi:14655_t:CDS:2, partial [Funneliformis mosseae]